MTDKHLSTQFDAELSDISTRVLEMGGMVESQVARSVYALTNFSAEIASEVLSVEERVNQTEIEIDREALKIGLQYPELAGAPFDELSAEALAHPQVLALVRAKYCCDGDIVQGYRISHGGALGG